MISCSGKFFTHESCYYNPQCEAAISLDVTVILPNSSAMPPVNAFMASSATIPYTVSWLSQMMHRRDILLNPLSAWSMASTLMLFDTFLLLVYVRFQQEPQDAEFQPAMADAPPM